MYSYTKEGGGGGKTAKGVKKSVVKKTINMTTIEMSYLTHNNSITK